MSLGHDTYIDVSRVLTLLRIGALDTSHFEMSPLKDAAH